MFKTTKITLPLTILLLTLFVVFGVVHKASAVTAADWKAGRIIDDVIFFNKDSMTAAQIQDFLNAKIPVCDTNGTGLTSRWNATANRYYTRAEWGALVGYPAPFTCLKDYKENPTAKTNNYATPTIPLVGGLSAAQIIWDASQQYNINPQVLLVLLQKEQSLVTDDWPYSSQYLHATGANCPDTGSGCDPTYNGFYTQVNRAAYLFNYYKNNITQFNFNVGTNYILWNVATTNCGGNNVNIENIATAMLYIYTPYQPNASSLNNMLGQGDACSSYGNRNFWRYFNDWFGSSIFKYYEFVSAINPPSVLEYGQVVTVELKVKNDMQETWYSDGHLPTGGHPIRLMLRGYKDTDFADTSDPAWLGTKNQIKMVEASVSPGATATFSYRLKAPFVSIQNQQLNMLLVKDGVQVYDDLGLQFVVTSKPDYAYQIKSVDFPKMLSPGDAYQVKFILTNTGVEKWYSDDSVSSTNPHPIRIATPYYTDSPFEHPSTDVAWLGTKNQIKMQEPVVDSGSTATFTALIVAPYKKIENYDHKFALVLDGVKFIPGQIMNTDISVPQPNFNYLFVDAINPPSQMKIGDIATATIRIKNNGNSIWRNFNNKILGNNGTTVELGDMRLITNAPVYRNSLFSDSSTEWLGTKNQLQMVEGIVGPGQIATFRIPWKAPLVTGAYSEYFIFGIDGTAIFKDLGLAFFINVTP
jgi:hypothetical protein